MSFFILEVGKYTRPSALEEFRGLMQLNSLKNRFSLIYNFEIWYVRVFGVADHEQSQIDIRGFDFISGINDPKVF